MTGGDRLLEDVLVVEHGDRIAARACGTLLAQLGARVVAIERADAARHAGLMLGKESIVLGSSEADRAIEERLVESADVLLLASKGDEGALWNRDRAATQIVCDITAFGHRGPLAGREGSEALLQAAGGIVDTSGRPDRPPSIVRAPVLEMSTAVYAAAAIVAALRVRRLHGTGQRIDIALYDTAVNELVNFLTLHYGGQPARRSGNRHPLYTPWGSFRASDGFVLLCAVTIDQFARVCKAIGRPELVDDPRFGTAQSRRAHHREIDAIIEQWSIARPVDECVKTMSSLGVACGPVIPVDRLADEPNIVLRRSIARLLDKSTEQKIAVPLSPIRIDRERRGIGAIARPGEHREQVLSMLDERERLHPRDMHRVRSNDDPPIPALPLDGIRVVEIGHYTVAPLASRQMGALGADVIKVEPPAGDATRNGVPLRDDGLSLIFALSNTDKRGLMLDLAQERDRERLDRLLAQSDVLVENLRPGALAKFGFDSATLAARHPRLIYCPMSGFGAHSAYPGRPALDTVIQAMSGLMSLTVDDGEPVKAGVSASDMLGGEFGLLAVLAALEARDRTGNAVHFDVSMHDCSAWMTQTEWSRETASASKATLVEAADGWVVAEGDPAAIAALASNGARKESREVLASRLQASGVAAMPVRSVAEVVEHPHTIARELLVRRSTGPDDHWTVLNCPIHLLSTPPRVRRVMTRLGADDGEVIAQFSLDG